MINYTIKYPQYEFKKGYFILKFSFDYNKLS